MHAGILRLISVSLLIGLSGNVRSAPVAIGVDGPFQASASSDGVISSIDPMELWFERDRYGYTGGSIVIHTAITEDEEYLPEREYRWRFEWHYPDGSIRYAAFTYEPATDCVTEDASGVAFCDVSAQELGFRIFRLFTGLEQRCVPEEGSYRLSAAMDQSPAYDHTYRPAPFRVGAPSVELTPNEIHPAVRAGATLDQEAIDPGTTTIIAIVRDAWDCNAAIAGARVEIENTLPEASAGHYHFAADEEGTGTYTEVTNAEHAIEEPASLWAVSDEQGRVSATYRAGSLGVLENVTATAYNREDSEWPYPDDEQLQSTSEELTIRVPDLVHLERSGATYALKGSGSALDLHHNRDADTRNSHWVTPYAYMKAQQLNDLWSVADPEGRDLCYNDGSLEYGGTFDNGERPPREPGASPTNRLHYYHQVGKDVDVNRYGCAGYARFVRFEENENGEAVERQVTMFFRGRERSKQEVLDALAREEGGIPYPETTIHYRFH